MLRFISLCFLLFSTILTSAQTAPDTYLVRFKDKNNTPFSLAHPEEYLGPKAIQKRQLWNIPIDSLDIPVNQTYINQAIDVEGCKLHHASKWFNSITITITDTLLTDLVLDHINALDFVIEVKNLEATLSDYLDDEKFGEPTLRKELTDFSLQGEYEKFYGPSFRQVSMINAHLLHEIGYTGEGIDIAVFDGGWNKADVLPCFDRLRARNALVETKDFVFPESNNVYNYSSHGTYVLSTMAAWMPDSLIGTAPDARYYLFRTENVVSEYVVEEDNWAVAAAYADSIGIDIINSSLGYSEFQDALQNHTYADMNGDVCRSSIAADIASAKGILVVNSAGNSGDDPWRYITAPSDGDSVLCVGAVDAWENRAAFSSVGPSSDGNVKPNVMAMGRQTVLADLDSTIRVGNGTSFSSPLMAGGVACLMQAVYEKQNNMSIIHAVEKSADHYLSPSDTIGYGIPDLWKALSILRPEWAKDLKKDLISIFPNPATTEVHITTEWLLGNDEVTYEIYDAIGRCVYSGKTTLTTGLTTSVITISWHESEINPGRYTLLLKTAQEKRIAPLVVR